MEKEFILYTDSSNMALGAVLAQFDEFNFPCPVAFASRKLKDVETRYSATERELLAVVWAINYFKCYLYNNKFTVYTDHAALTNSLKLSNPPSRIGRWLTAIADYRFDIKYIKGRCNTIADFLSRFVEYEIEPVVEVLNNNEMEEIDNDMINNLTVQNVNIKVGVSEMSNSTDNYAGQVENNNFVEVSQENVHNVNNIVIGDSESLLVEIREAQQVDKFCSNVFNRLLKDLEIKPKHVKFFVEDEILMCRYLKPKSRKDHDPKIVLPRCLVPRIFNLAHCSATACHAGFFKTVQRIKANYFWVGMLADVKKLVKSCQSCLEYRAHRPKILAQMQKLEIPEAPFLHVHCDVAGPYSQTFSGNRYIVSFVDSFSKWPEAFAVPNVTSDTIAEVLAKFICRHGCPKVLISDRGTNFLSKAIEMVYKKLGIKHVMTTAYRPQSNAKIERQHATINSALAHLVNSSHNNWDENLDFALLALRSAVHSSINETPFFVTTGRDIRLPYNVLASKHHFNYNDTPSYCENLIPTLSSIYKSVKSNIEAVADKQVQNRDKVAKDKQIKVNDLVMLFTPVIKPGLSKKFAKCNSGPFRVMERTGQVNYKIQDLKDANNVQNVHVDRLTKMITKPTFPAWPDEGILDEEVETVVDTPQSVQQGVVDPLANFNSRTRRRRRMTNFPMNNLVPLVQLAASNVNLFNSNVNTQSNSHSAANNNFNSNNLASEVPLISDVGPSNADSEPVPVLMNSNNEILRGNIAKNVQGILETQTRDGEIQPSTSSTFSNENVNSSSGAGLVSRQTKGKTVYPSAPTTHRYNLRRHNK